MNPTDIHDSLVTKGKEKARASAYATTTDRLRKQVRAFWKVHFINEGKTIGLAEELAILEEEYKQACTVAEKAEKESGEAAVEYEAAKAWVEIWRSLESTRRAEMTLR